MKENFYILIQISLKGPMDNDSSLIQVMAWWKTGDKPLLEPMLVSDAIGCH